MNTNALRRFPFQAMGGFCEIQFLDLSRTDARKKVRQLTQEIARLEGKYSRFQAQSFVSEINTSAGNSLGIKIDSETMMLFDHALSCFKQSDGLFDITSGVLRQVWDFKSGVVPAQEKIDALLPNIGYDKLLWRNNRLRLPKGMEIDFGGIVKEYAADSVAQMARNIGIDSGLVNLGGDFAVIGPLPDNRPWPVGIQHPDDRNTLMARLELATGGLASSGDYERSFMHEGKRYSHILNPKTGWPCDGLRAVSVGAPLCTIGGSVATIAMLKPEDEGIAWLEEIGLPNVYMSRDGDIRGAKSAQLTSATDKSD